MARRLFTVWLLALALVGAQALGFAHRVAHGPVGTAAASGSELFADHEGQTTCPLYDQLSGTAITPAVPVLCLPVIPSSFFIALAQGDFLVRWAALYDARGPPSLR